MKKKFLFLMSLLAVSLFALAEMTVYVYKKDGTKVPYTAANVDSVGFVDVNHEYVDLGLSVMWATCNIGANSPDEIGNLYQWGELIPCGISGSSGDYKWSGPEVNTYIKYVTTSGYGKVDDRTELEFADDVANMNWLGNWRMPSKTEAQELIDNCTWSEMVINGVKGYEVVSKINGKSIFLPHSPGDYVGTQYSYSYYWTNTGSNKVAYALANSYYGEVKSVGRHGCLLVRPVYTAKKYRFSINFNANGAIGGMETVVVNNGSTITLPNNDFYLDGTFIEWNTKPDGTGISYANRATITPTEDMTLYAQWKLAYDGIENGHKYVDLGLSVKWATCNLGADAPSYQGSLYAWGEIKTKDSYYSTDYDEELEEKYNDNKTVLELEDDAAHVNWGGNWRMPTKEEIEELINPENCTWSYSSKYPRGYTITSKKNGNSIFLPTTKANRGGNTYSDVDGYGFYWTSTFGIYLEFGVSRYSLSNGNRSYGHQIRPVLR